MAGLLPHRARRGELSLGYRTAQVQRGLAGTASKPHATAASAEFGQTSDFGAFHQRSVDRGPQGAGLLHRPNKIYSADGAINVENGWHFLTGTDTAYTLAPPDDDRDDGIELHIIADAATAFVITTPEVLRGDSGAADDDTATFGGAIGDQLHLVADGGVWHIITSKNITFALTPCA